MKEQQNQLSFSGRCPSCGANLLFACRPFSHSMAELMMNPKHTVYSCRSCGRLFDVNMRRYQWIGTLICILWIPVIVAGLYVASLPFKPCGPLSAVAIVLALAGMCVCMFRIKCLTPLVEGKKTDNK